MINTAQARAIFALGFLVWVLAAIDATSDHDSGWKGCMDSGAGVPAGGEGCYWCTFHYQRLPGKMEVVDQIDEGDDIDNPWMVIAIQKINRNPQMSRMVITSKWDATQMGYAAFPTPQQEDYQRKVAKLMTPEARKILALTVYDPVKDTEMHGMGFPSY